MTTTLQPMTALDSTPLFRPLLAELLGLLRGLSDADWDRPTIAGVWRVRDIAAHLLDGDLRRLAICRDGHRLPIPPPQSYDEVLALVTELNATGVGYATRLSSRLIVELLAISGEWVADYFASLPLHERAIFSVSWAGEFDSANWMDIGRDYTERWHHQMQLRDAVGAPKLLLEPRWLAPLLDLSVRALPVAYRGVEAADDTAVVLRVAAAEPLVWSVVRSSAGWQVFRGAAADAATTVTADPDTAWKVLYHALTPAEARGRVSVSGDERLAAPLLRARSVMVAAPT